MEELSKEQELFWRKELSTLRGPFPEVGLDPPKEEQVTIEEPKESVGGMDVSTVGNFSKLTVDVFFFMNPETNKYFIMRNESLVDYGPQSLKKAIALVKRRQKGNKG